MPEYDPDLNSSERALRLAALIRMREAHPKPAAKGTNTHVHTNYSFSAFNSPHEAAWLAYESGVEIFGINDHYTVDGHPEFAEACHALNLPATFSIESVAMDQTAAAEGVLLNDPGNPGRIYLSGKGVTKRDDKAASKFLSTLRGHQERRNKDMIAKVDAYFREHFGVKGPEWEAVESQTPLGNTTERHIARAIHDQIIAIAGEGGDVVPFYEKMLGSEPKADPAGKQNQIRSALLKSGKPCYVDEDPASYPPLEALRGLFLQLGSIPTYPILGNPVTGGEEDIAALCDRLESYGIHALELIPSRNTDDRVEQAIAEASKRGWIIVDGTEHNTPAMDPLLTRWGSDERFRPRFRDGALALLGHQALCAAGDYGYLDSDGKPVADAYERCLAAGKEAFRVQVA